MPEGPAVAVFVLLALPGLLALGIYQSLTPTRASDTSVKAVLWVVLSVISYLAVAATHALLNKHIAWVPNPSALLLASSEDLSTVFSPEVLWVVALACVYSVMIAILLVVQTSNEWLHRLCRRCRITRRLGYSSHWDSVAHKTCRHSWINIKFNDGDQYTGALESHSDASDERSLLLSSVAKVRPDGENEYWEKTEFLFVPDISSVRSIRIRVVNKGVKNAEE